jgi:hypothetical protein
LAEAGAAAAPVPQDEPRCNGRVVDAQGKPVAGAAVTLLHRPIPWSLDGGPESRVAGATDASGRFRAEFAADTVYSAWARWNGKATAIAEGVEAGEFVELREAPGAGPQTITLTGLEAWPDAAMFGFRAAVGTEHLDFVSVERRGDRIEVPALPPRRVRVVEMLDGAGEIVWAADCPPVDATGATIAIPPPEVWPVRVTGADGAPIAGARVRWHLRNYWYCESDILEFRERFLALWPVAGTTDADGRLAVRKPKQDGYQRLLLVTMQDGHEISFDGLCDGFVFKNGEGTKEEAPAEPGPAPLEIRLRKAPELAIPLRDSRNAAFAGGAAMLATRASIKLAKGGRGIPLHLSARVGDGRLHLPALPAAVRIEAAMVLLSPATRAAAKRAHGFAPRAAHWLARAESLLDDQKRAANEAIDGWQTIAVVAADGRPAAHVPVPLCVPGTNDARILRTDRLGRALAPPAQWQQAFVSCAAGAGEARVAADAKGPTRLHLQRLATLRGRLSDDRGEPVAGQRVRVRDCKLVEGTEPCLARLLAVAAVEAVTGIDGAFTLALPPFVAAIELDVPGRKPTDGQSIDIDPAADVERRVVVAAN